MLLLVLFTLLLVSDFAASESLKSKVKMARSNPVLPVLIDGESMNLVLTTGAWHKTTLRLRVQ